MLRQQGRLKGKQAQHMVHTAPHSEQAFGAPGPNRGADKVHGFNATRAQLRFQVKVEIGRVHADEKRRRVFD